MELPLGQQIAGSTPSVHSKGRDESRKANSMSRKMKSFCAISVLSLCLGLTLGAASPAGAAGHHKAKSKTSAPHHKVKPPCKNALHSLGTHKASRLSAHAPLKTAAQLKKAFADKKFQKIVQRVFDEARLGASAQGLIAAVAAVPDDAQPKDVPVGAKFDWMAYRKHGKPRLMSDACWAGKGPFQGWVFTLPGAPGGDGDLDFIVPVPCGNISRVEPPTCILKTDKQGDTTILDLTGSKAGSLPIATYGSTPTLPQDTPGVFKLAAAKCDPGAVCNSAQGTLWVEDGLGFRSASSQQCSYSVPGVPQPPICKLVVTYDPGVFHIDASGTGSAVQTVVVSGVGPKGEKVNNTLTGPTPRLKVDMPYQPRESGDWTFNADALGLNGLHSDPNCTSTVRACVPPVAKIVSANYNCETRQMTIDTTGSSDHRKLTVTGPGGPEVLTGNGPIYTYDVKRSGPYSAELVADDAICPETATATSSQAVAPFGDTAKWNLRVFGAYLRSSDDRFHETLNGGTPIEERRHFDLGGHHGGFGAGFEYRPLHVCDLSRWGVAVDVIDSELDSHIMIDSPRGWGMTEQKVSILPVLLSLNYHFTPGQRADFFAGPTVGYAFLGNATFHTLGLTYNESFKDDFTYGLNLGLDIPFGAEHNYAFTVGLRQLFLKAKASGASNFSLDVNPTIATAGITFRFR